MGNKLHQLYESFLYGGLPFQKDVGVLPLEKMIVITGTTGAGKSTLIKELQLPNLVSYKTGDIEVEIRPSQLYVTPEKFAKKFEKGDFFDVYKLGCKYYAYALRDYFVVQKEYGKVFIEVSLENLARGIQYIPKNIVILSPSEVQLEFNLRKRAGERGYNEEKIKEVANRQKNETGLIDKIKQKYKNCVTIESLSDILQLL